MTNAQKAIISNGVARASALCVLLLMFSILAPLSAQVSSGGGVVGIAPLVGAPASAPTFWHKFNNSSGNSTATIGDNCANSNHTMVENGTLNYAIDFNGTTTVSSCGANYDAKTTFSISLWALLDSYGEGAVGTLFTKSSGANFSWALRTIGAQGRLTLRCVANTSNAGEVYGTSASNTFDANIGVWTHIVGVCECSGMSCTTGKIYVNGEDIGATLLTDSSGSLIDDSAFVVAVGSFASDANGSEGLIDDVRFYEYAMTQQTAQWIYRGSRQ